MKQFLTVLSILTIGVTAGNLSSELTTILNNNNINTSISNKLTNTDDPIIHNFEYNFHDSYDKNTSKSDNSSTYTLLNWKEHAKDWNQFISTWNFFGFIKEESSFSVSLNKQSDNPQLATITNDIKTNQGSGDTNSIFKAKLQVDKSEIYASINIWHDNSKIYFI